MDVKKTILLVGALVMAGVSAFMAKTMFGASGTPQAVAAGAQPAPIEGPEILVATKALPVGTIIDPESFRYQPWPKDLMKDAYYLKEAGEQPQTLAGTVVRYAITAGQPLTRGALVKPGDRGFLAAALGPGMRAVTVPVSAQSGVAGFIFPGDRVDLLLSQEVTGGGDGPSLKVAETIVRNLRVLATDQRTDNQTDSEGKTQVVTFSTVTVESTPKIAEKIAVAQTMGSISLSLRSIADNTQELERAIASGEVDVPEESKAERSMMLAIASRPSDTNTTFTVGGDVSRYQRRTVPAKPASAATGAPGGGAAKPEGPSVRVARGSNIEFVPVGGK